MIYKFAFIELQYAQRLPINWYDFRDAANEAGYDGAARMEAHWKRRDFDEVLVYDGSRFGRKESIFAEFVLRTIDAKAIIVQHLGGVIDETNYSSAMLLGAYATGQEMRTRRLRTDMGRDGRFERGKHNGPLPISHVEVYDSNHKPTGDYVLNEALLHIWPDVAELVLQGVGWNHLERELYKRYKHINPLTGRPFVKLAFYRCLTMSPMFWGHLSRRHGYDPVTNTDAELGPMRWTYDESYPVPEGVQVKRNVFPPVYTGALAEAIKDEIRRRHDLRGKAAADRVRRFTALCVCADCGHTMVLRRVYKNKTGKSDLVYVMCNYNVWKCSNHGSVRIELMQQYITEILERVFAGDTWLLSRSVDTDKEERRAKLSREVAQLDANIESLVSELALMPEVARGHIRKRIDAMAERMTEAQRELSALNVSVVRDEEAERLMTKTVEELKKETLAAFWTRSDIEINQILKRLLQSMKFVVKDSRIVGLA